MVKQLKKLINVATELMFAVDVVIAAIVLQVSFYEVVFKIN